MCRRWVVVGSNSLTCSAWPGARAVAFQCSRRGLSPGRYSRTPTVRIGIFEQPLAAQRHVAERVAGGQAEALERHDLGIHQQVVLARHLDLARGQAEDVARAQGGRAEGVKAARAAA